MAVGPPRREERDSTVTRSRRFAGLSRDARAGAADRTHKDRRKGNAKRRSETRLASTKLDRERIWLQVLTPRGQGSGTPMKGRWGVELTSPMSMDLGTAEKNKSAGTY